MLDIALHFEQTAAGLRPIMLIGPGLACTVVGLFVWLGGLGFRKLLVAILGAVSGGICGFFVIGQNIMPAAISAIVGAAIALIFEKIFITILAAGLAAVSGFIVLAALNTVDLSNGLRQACLDMPVYNWAIVATLVAASIVAGVYLRRLTSALCCAALGTLLVFTGMILLLLYKVAAPISNICSKAPYYSAVFVTMIAFGAVVQLFLCRRYDKQLKKETSKDKQEHNQTRMSWRGQ